MTTNIQVLKAVKSLLLFALLTSVGQTLIAAETTPEWRYSVRPGDNLIQFSNKHLINPDDWRTLQKLNAIKNPNKLRLGQIIRVPLALVKQAPAPVEVLLVSGQAGLVKSDKSLQILETGQLLSAGAELSTGQNSRLDLKFADGSVVSMQPNSSMKLDTLSMYSGGGMVDTKLRLQQGKVEVAANPKHQQGNQMQILTPSAVAAVRGTQFRVAADASSIKQETLEGNVALSAAGEEVAVTKGFGSLSEGGAAPLPPVLLLAAPNTDKLATKLNAVPVAFDMAPQDGAVAWLGQVSSDAQFNTILAENASQGVTLTLADIPDGRYYLKVRAKDQKGLEGYDATHSFDLNARPFAPQSTKPSESETLRDANPEFAWAPVEEAKGYLVEVAQDETFKNVLETHQVSGNSYKLEKNLAPGQYYWRLTSIEGAFDSAQNQSESQNKGPYGKVNRFSYKPKPNAPDISQLKVQVHQNKVFVNTANPPEGLSYEAILHNEQNNQLSVWSGKGLGAEFSFLLKEFGKQKLVLRYEDADGVTGPDAIYEFDAPAP